VIGLPHPFLAEYLGSKYPIENLKFMGVGEIATQFCVNTGIK
jgi:hypothetical protein